MDDMNSVQSKIDEETLREIEKLSNLELGSEEYKRAAEGIERLRGLSLKDSEMDMAYDEALKKIENQARELEQRERELDLKDIELDNQREDHKKNRIKDLILGAITVLIPAGLYAGYVKKGFDFEENDGIYTSTTHRNTSNNFTQWVKSKF